MSVINTNVKALAAQASMSNVNKSMETAMERLSTGIRINSAKDDAAGLAIALRAARIPAGAAGDVVFVLRVFRDRHQSVRRVAGESAGAAGDVACGVGVAGGSAGDAGVAQSGVGCRSGGELRDGGAGAVGYRERPYEDEREECDQGAGADGR